MPVLGVTQILSWGTIFYTPVLIVPLIAAERGWSISFAMGGFSIGLLVAGLVAPYVGRSIDRFGGHVVMTLGSLTGALGLFLIGSATHPIAYYAVWMVLGVAMAANLYDAAFSTLGRIFGIGARRPITALTLAGGFASTVSWPVTHVLLERVDWRGTYLIYAALLACVAAPLHALALPRTRYQSDADASRFRKCARKSAAAVRDCHSFSWLRPLHLTPSSRPGLSAHLLAIFAREGIDAATVVWIGALFGPAQVGARLIEFAFGRNLHPLWIARFALTTFLCAFLMLVLLGVSTATAAAFALMFGGANGLITITRGAVPLALVRRVRLRAADGTAGRPIPAGAGGGAFHHGVHDRAHIGSGSA